MSKSKLEGVLQSGDLEKCRDFFMGMPEQERRKLAPDLIRLYRQADKGPTYNAAEKSYSFDNVAVDVLGVAIFSTGTAAEIKKLGWRGEPENEMMLAIMLDRRPEWIQQWVDALLESPRFPWYWTTIRKLYLEGLIEKPDHPNYTLGMVVGLQPPGGAFRTDEPSIEEAIEADRSLLEDEVWRLFEHEGGTDVSLALADGGAKEWQKTLILFQKKGGLSRERLLNCSLDALLRDFNHFRAKWFSSFYDALEPTPEENKSQAGKFLQILGVSAPPVVSWAFANVETLAKASAIPADDLAAGLLPVFQSRQKGIVKKALKLLGTLAGKRKGEASQIVAFALPALGHESAEVQADVLAMIEKYGDVSDAKFVRSVAEYVPVIAPSERKRLDAWLAAAGAKTESPAAAPASSASFDQADLEAIDSQLRQLYAIDDLLANRQAGLLEIPAARFDGTEINRLAGKEKIQPIEDLDELIEVCSRLIEDPTATNDVERAIDGISRLCDQKPDDFQRRVDPLLRRTLKLLKDYHLPFQGGGPQEDLLGLIYAWCTGIVLEGKRIKAKKGEAILVYKIDGEECKTHDAELDIPLGFLSRRTLAIAQRVAQGKPAQLWSAPTHEGSWIDSQTLVQRVLDSSGKPSDDSDAILAILRMTPDGREAALAELKTASTEAAKAVRYALGAARMKVGNSAPLWIAAARSRAPWSDDLGVEKAFPGLGADAGLAARYETKIWIDEYKHSSEQFKFARFSLNSIPTVPETLDPLCLTPRFHRENRFPIEQYWKRGEAAGRTVEGIAWTASIWPQARESLFAIGACTMGNNLDWDGAEWHNKTFLEPLLDPTTPLREIGLLLLAMCLGAKEPGEHGLATDIAIAAIEDGRLGSDNLGAILSQLVPSGLIKPPRWAKTLADVARISALHGAVVHLALQQTLVGDASSLPRDYAKLMELLLQLSIERELSVTHPDCRAMLESLKGSGKGPKLAKDLLKLTAAPESGPRILELALQQRISAVQLQVDQVTA
ncbi:DUF6493 family protein [Blastopirellula sp. JC732]|uniref:DUF6493 family protein n=1 Tax=Blastopirellula sediminis TaxID=2894196 RepID=A0A9X1MQK8_9BACT|nr:DUF6493 family protein [Blastopirellula sediminis]MCC9606131.1 DUF6493 family protein [Blastopirellula sediminis]MCC9630570.1 DUF6493 family protein [Blastopirellula sediminis]